MARYFIYFDTNEQVGSNAFGLWLDRSLQDLEQIRVEEREGLVVTIYTPNDIEMQATLTFDYDCKCWTAVPVPNTVRDLFHQEDN